MSDNTKIKLFSYRYRVNHDLLYLKEYCLLLLLLLYGLGGRFESFRFTEQNLPSCELLETGGLIGCCVK